MVLVMAGLTFWLAAKLTIDDEVTAIPSILLHAGGASRSRARVRCRFRTRY
jgi:hypothetical protein